MERWNDTKKQQHQKDQITLQLNKADCLQLRQFKRSTKQPKANSIATVVRDGQHTNKVPEYRNKVTTIKRANNLTI